MVSRNRSQQGVRLTSDERRQIEELWPDKNIGEIAKQIGRHRETVSNYISSLRADDNVAHLRQEALRDAQVAHWEDLRRAAMSLRDKFGTQDPPRAIPKGWEELLQDQRDSRYLVEALAKRHAPDHALWSELKTWGSHVEALRAAHEEAGKWFAHELSTSWSWEMPKGQLKIALVDEWFRAIRNEEPKVPEVDERKGGFGLFRGGVTLSLAPTKEAMESARVRWGELLPKATSWSLTSNAKLAYRALKNMEPNIKELTDRLSMIRAFPGECEFCPLRSTRRRRNNPRGW